MKQLNFIPYNRSDHFVHPLIPNFVSSIPKCFKRNCVKSLLVSLMVCLFWFGVVCWLLFCLFVCLFVVFWPGGGGGGGSSFCFALVLSCFVLFLFCIFLVEGGVGELGGGGGGQGQGHSSICALFKSVWRKPNTTFDEILY